jgi:hypothetical protein
MAELPATLRGLATALHIAHLASASLAHSSDEAAERGPDAVAILCGAAAACLDPDPPSPTPEQREWPIARPDDPTDAVHLRELDTLLRDCLDLAVEVLDNEEEPLFPDHVHDIGAAVELLDRARAACSEVAL